MSPSEDEASSTPGLRLYLIRRDLGPNPRNEMTLRSFAELVNARAEVLGYAGRYDHSTIAKTEKGLRQMQIDEVPLFASLDPKQRGPAWLAWGELAPARQTSPIDGLPTDEGHLVDVTPSHQKKAQRRRKNSS